MSKEDFKKKVKIVLKEMIESGEIQFKLVQEDMEGKNYDKYSILNLEIHIDDDIIESNGQIWINKL
ncbi:MAG: hypothetical protein BGO41_01365 [Clostridiales bacterium 38-18]|nr:MAG: hypothetical protein BGO41_01365 [Clostridiales bacterium 38-18]